MTVCREDGHRERGYRGDNADRRQEERPELKSDGDRDWRTGGQSAPPRRTGGFGGREGTPMGRSDQDGSWRSGERTAPTRDSRPWGDRGDRDDADRRPWGDRERTGDRSWGRGGFGDRRPGGGFGDRGDQGGFGERTAAYVP